MKRLFVLLLLAAAPCAAADGGFRIVNWPSAYTCLPATGTNVTVQNFTITGSTTANQSVASYTVPAGATFYLQYAEAEAYYLTFSTSVSNFGAAYFSVNGAHAYTTQLAGAGISRTGQILFDPPLVFPAGTVLSWLVSPAAGTGTVWYGNIGGHY